MIPIGTKVKKTLASAFVPEEVADGCTRASHQGFIAEKQGMNLGWSFVEPEVGFSDHTWN